MSDDNVRDLIREALAAGLELVPDGEHLTVRGDEAEVKRFVPLLRQHKPELLRLLADPTAPCPTCGSGSYWHDGTTWHCEGCTPACRAHRRAVECLSPSPCPWTTTTLSPHWRPWPSAWSMGRGANLYSHSQMTGAGSRPAINPYFCED